MSVSIVARKDLADAGRSKALWAVTAVVVLSTTGTTAALAAIGSASTEDVFQLALQLAVSTLPIVALVLAKGAITGERESGSIRVLLSLPPSRRDVVVGKLVGRTVLMLVATLVGGLGMGVVALTLLGGGLDLLMPFVAVLGLLGAAYVAIGIGISALSATDGRATAYAVGAYMLLVALWNLIYAGLRVGATELGLIESGATPAWLQLVGLLPPNRAATVGYDAVVEGQALAADAFSSLWLPVTIMLAWIVVPVAVGHARFRTADIG